MYMYMHMYIYVCICMCDVDVDVDVYVYVDVDADAYVDVDVDVDAGVYVDVFVDEHVHVNVHVNVHVKVNGNALPSRRTQAPAIHEQAPSLSVASNKMRVVAAPARFRFGGRLQAAEGECECECKCKCERQCKGCTSSRTSGSSGCVMRSVVIRCCSESWASRTLP